MFDPRSLVPVVLLLDSLVLASVPHSVENLALAILIVLLVLYRAWSQLVWTVATAFLLFGGGLLVARIDAMWAGALALLLGYTWRFVLAGALGWFLVTHISPSQFMAAMTRLRCPRTLLVPVAVVMRFFPTVVSEARAIGDSMRMRGLFGRGNRVIMHPLRAAEYLVIPLLASSVRSGDELAASALSRGFGSAQKRTTITQLRFRFVDVLLLLIGGAIAGYAFGWIEIS